MNIPNEIRTYLDGTLNNNGVKRNFDKLPTRCMYGNKYLL